MLRAELSVVVMAALLLLAGCATLDFKADPEEAQRRMRQEAPNGSM